MGIHLDYNYLKAFFFHQKTYENRRCNVKTSQEAKTNDSLSVIAQNN